MTDDEILMRRYLLGDLAEDERTDLEARYFTDANLFEGLKAFENDLIDSYARGELAPGERDKFEARYLSSRQGQGRIAFAKALSEACAIQKQHVAVPAAAPARKPSRLMGFPLAIPQWAWASAVVLLVAFGSWSTLRSRHLQAELQHSLEVQAELRKQSTSLQQQVADLEKQSEKPAPQSQAPEVAQLERPMDSVMSVQLIPGTARGSNGRQTTVSLSATTSKLLLQLVLERNDYKLYNATLRTSGRRQPVLQRNALPARVSGGNVVVSWMLPSASVASGDYIVQLSGVTGAGTSEEVASYAFRLLRK